MLDDLNATGQAFLTNTTNEESTVVWDGHLGECACFLVFKNFFAIYYLSQSFVIAIGINFSLLAIKFMNIYTGETDIFVAKWSTVVLLIVFLVNLKITDGREPPEINKVISTAGYKTWVVFYPVDIFNEAIMRLELISGWTVGTFGSVKLINLNWRSSLTSKQMTTVRELDLFTVFNRNREIFLQRVWENVHHLDAAWITNN